MSSGESPASRRHHEAASSGSSHAENASGRLPCLRRLKRSSSAAATILPSTTSAAAGSWKIALMPRNLILSSPAGVENRYREKRCSNLGQSQEVRKQAWPPAL